VLVISFLEMYNIPFAKVKVLSLSADKSNKRTAEYTNGLKKKGRKKHRGRKWRKIMKMYTPQ
jgi:hypothetical protein